MGSKAGEERVEVEEKGETRGLSSRASMLRVLVGMIMLGGLMMSDSRVGDVGLGSVGSGGRVKEGRGGVTVSDRDLNPVREGAKRKDSPT